MKIFGRVFLLALLVGCSKGPVVRAVKPAPTSVEATVTTISSGTVSAEQQAVLSFGVTGRISKIHVRSGDVVVKDQRIAELENRDLRVVYESAQKELRRSEQLFASQLIPRVGLDDARKSVEVARGNFDKTLIRAPFEGVIAELNLELGELASAQPKKTPVRLVDRKPRWIKGDIDEVDLARVRVGQRTRVRIPASGSESFEAEVSRVVPFVDTTKEQDRTSQIELKMKADATHTLPPVGASAEIEIIVERKVNALAVPTRVVLGNGATRYVFRVKDDKLVKTPVETGIGNYDRIEIKGGLTANDVAVYPTDEVELRDGLKVRPEVVAWP